MFQLTKRFHLTPVRLTVYSYLLLIFFGSILLMLPFATHNLKPANMVDALFTAASAVCVTGLAVQNTGTFFSISGQLVILLLIQLGGLGIMTLYASLPVLFGRQMRVAQRRMFSAVFDVEDYASLRSMLVCIVKYTMVIEMVGAIILSLRFYWLWGDWEKAIYNGVFHAISAFCNAGFVLFSNGLTDFSSDVIVNLVIVLLYLSGGLGFWVLYQIINRRSYKKLTAHAKLVLVTTFILVMIPCFLFFNIEYNNVLAGKSYIEKVLVTFMQMTTPRTAGFNSIDFSACTNATLFLVCILMFIGASPGGTGGGVKTSTIGLMFLSIRSIFRGQSDIECFGRKVAKDVITKAVAIVVVAFSIVSFFIIVLLCLFLLLC